MKFTNFGLTTCTSSTLNPPLRCSRKEFNVTFDLTQIGPYFPNKQAKSVGEMLLTVLMEPVHDIFG